MASATPSASEFAQSEMPGSLAGEATPGAPATSFPPYPPYATEPAPPSVADTIVAGRDLRVQHKSMPKRPVRPPPRPARPRGPKATDVKMSRAATRAHARCLRRHGAVLTDRLEYMSKPPRRSIIYLWREHAHTLPPETISRLRSMLDADEPFKPDQAYEYFINLRKTKKRNAAIRVGQVRRDLLAICADKRFVWARNATVAFAQGIQQRLSRPGRYALADKMLRLSNIILDEICGCMHTKAPSRRNTHPKARFMMEMADKVAVWIDEILAESDDRMLMMDFDEDDDVLEADAAGGGYGDAGFTDDFLNMMGGGGLFKGPSPAYLKFTGEMLEVFMILCDSMNKKGDAQLLKHGKFTQTYAEGADELKKAPDFEAHDIDTTLAAQLHKDLDEVSKPNTPAHLAAHMKEMINICGNYLAQHAEYNKDKGPAFRLLIENMRKKPNEKLYERGKAKRTFGTAATELENAKGLETDHDEPNLSQEIHSALSKTVESVTPADLKNDMAETLDLCSKYLSERAIDENERGPAFDLLIKTLEHLGHETFTPAYTPVAHCFEAAYVLKSAPGLTTSNPEPSTVPVFKEALHKAVDISTPKNLKRDMDEVIDRCANYLSAFVRDRDKAMQALLQMMKKNGSKELAKRNNFALTYGAGATEVETSPSIVPYAPIKDVADEMKGKLTTDMEGQTPPALALATKSAIQDVSKFLSQVVALRSGIGGERYAMNFLAAVVRSVGKKPLYKYKHYGQTYKDGGETLRFAGPLDYNPKSDNLMYQISSEMNRGVPSKLSPGITANVQETMSDASKHLAQIGMEKGEAMDHLLKAMREEGGDAPLGNLQGYTQSYVDGARRIENADTLENEKVDKGAYEGVRGKITDVSAKRPAPEHAKHMPGIIDDASKFLASPYPETEKEKRQVLADLMARKGDDIVGKDGHYKMTYKEGGAEIMNAPVGVTTAHDEAKRKEMLGKVEGVIPDAKLKAVLKDTAHEGAAHLTDKIKGRGEAMQVIHDELQKEKGKEFLSIGKFKATHEEAAGMIGSAPYFGGQRPNAFIEDKVGDKLKALNLKGGSPMAQKNMADTADITKKYLAGVATTECGLDPTQLAALDPALANMKKGAGGRGGKGGGAETEEERRRREAEEARLRAAGGGGGPESEEERRRREAAEAEARRRAGLGAETEEERRRREAEEARLRAAGGAGAGGAFGVGGPGGFGAGSESVGARRRREEEERKRREALAREMDPERRMAQEILQAQLKAKGHETLYKQAPTELSHVQAANWLADPPTKVDKSVKESGDTDRLHKKFERKLSNLVSKATPPHMYDTMQDVVIESSRQLSEYFVSSNYKVLAREGLISEMQKKGNEILVDVDGTAETFFFAAQRLKKAEQPLKAKEPCSQVAYQLIKKLDDMIRCRSMARKLTATMKDHIKEAAEYLSGLVTKPDPEIEAYVALLGEMESRGDSLLVEGAIPKSYFDAANYLRQLTSWTDHINRPKSSLQSSIESKLKTMMSNVEPRGYTKAVMDGVIQSCTKLLVSYMMLQAEKTEALKVLIEQMEKAGDGVLLRHGTIHKSYSAGAEILRGKNSDQLSVPNADPVVARKIQIKFNNLMSNATPDKYKNLMDDVIEDATMYLAVHFLHPQVIQVCKCMKNVFVQCELWCDEILRRVARPCCTCSRHVSVQALADLAPATRLRLSPGSSRAFAPGLQISLSTCPKLKQRGKSSQDLCPAPDPTSGCNQVSASYLLYSTSYDRSRSPGRLPRPSDKTSSFETTTSSTSLHDKMLPPSQPENRTRAVSSDSTSHLEPEQETSNSTNASFHTPASEGSSNAKSKKRESPFWQTSTTMYANIDREDRNVQAPSERAHRSTSRSSQKRAFSSRTPIVSTDQMGDWHAMMVSLMWNVQAWRDWIQENIEKALAWNPPDESPDNWATFQRRVSQESLQWRQYNIFSRQLTLRLALRYRDKQIVSPTRATVKTDIYMECQREMLDIIDMFNRWTHWLNVVIKETDTLQSKPGSEVSLQVLRWNHFKEKVQEYADDWSKYNTHLKLCWEHKYKTIISDWLPAWLQHGPVWVVSACGAVPSGAVAAGVFDGEVTWVARTTHKCNVLPAALHPSKHYCLVYADGAVHHYTKYQVMCNAEVKWLAWRAGEVGARAVKVAPGIYVGRVHYRGSHLLGPVHAPSYRCHVVIFGRPFAFNCYELLVLAANNN
ncbi:uncharacterized protein LOC128679445 isoform X2 [Plodia interpunctella]|uniref:uncharacterized protein LOC128679445 isoform X2 n=1 Tax=Plodia interpunctella TaxID=58824 RepID=UPI0023681677|nr:uncharacterized protein LOC128679445 isoform X2 [Plodia interpunctella]